MIRDDVRVVELVGCVMPRFLGQLASTGDHVANVLRSDLWPPLDGRNDVELRAERPHQLEALFGEAVGDHDQSAISLRPADERERRTGTSARVLDHRFAGRKQPVPLGTLDHCERHPVLHRPGRVAVLELQPHVGAVGRHAMAETHNRSVPDRFENGLHASIISEHRYAPEGERGGNLVGLGRG